MTRRVATDRSLRKAYPGGTRTRFIVRTPPTRVRHHGRRYLAIRTADSAPPVCAGALAFGARDPPLVNIPSGPMTAVLDYRAPMVVDGEPAQIVRIRPLLSAVVPRAIGVEARVLGAHCRLALVESRLGSRGWNAMAAGASHSGQFASRELAAADGPSPTLLHDRLQAIGFPYTPPLS